jgi:hypothetical protein
MFKSRWVFSITLAASATLMLEALMHAGFHNQLHTSPPLCPGSLECRQRNHLHDGTQGVHLVAGVDPLRRVSDVEIGEPG